MVNPLEALKAFQIDIDSGVVPLEDCQLDPRFKYCLDGVNDKSRISCFKICGGNVASYAALVHTGKENGVPVFQAGYAVLDGYREAGLGKITVIRCISEVKRLMRGYGVNEIIIEAVVELNNEPSIKLAKRCISSTSRKIVDEYTDKPCLFFQKTLSTIEPTSEEYFLSKGVTPQTIEELEGIAPLDIWLLYAKFPDNEQEPITVPVQCPKCGSVANYSIDAVTDFFCPDDEECGYDYVEDHENLKPIPVGF